MNKGKEKLEKYMPRISITPIFWNSKKVVHGVNIIIGN
jgi:hypothetical protein